MKLKNPAILITGGGRRIGLEIARRSVALGYDVVIQHRGDNPPARRWLAAEPALADRVVLLQKKDICADAVSLIRAARDLSRHLVGLVNNASVFKPGNLMRAPSFDALLRVNALVPLDLSRAFAQAVRSGWIINMTDANVDTVSTRYQNYRISKLLLIELTRQLAVLLGPRIRVNAIAPGAVLPAPGENPRMLGRLRTSAPMRTGGTMEDVLSAYEYLLGGTTITGQILYADGGLHAR